MKKKHTKLVLAIIVLLAVGVITVLLTSQQRKKITSYSITAPFADADIPYNVIPFCNDTTTVIYTEKGTRLTIPAGIIAPAKNSPQTCNFILQFRELHDVWDIFLSGIPMQINGTDQLLQSAGMIDIRITQKNIPVELKPGTSISVDLAAFTPSAQYSLFYLNNDKDWMLRDTFRTDSNRIKLQRLTELKKKEPQKQDSMDLRFSLVADLEEVPYLKPFIGLTWEPAPNQNNQELEVALRMQWDEVKVEEVNRKKMLYQLRFIKRMDVDSGPAVVRRFSVLAIPHTGFHNKKENRKALKSSMAEFEAAYQQYKDEEKRIAAEADIVNQFSIDKLGIWNIDRVCDSSLFMLVNAEIRFSENKQTGPDKIFAIYEDLNSVMSFSRADWKRLAIHRNGRMCLVAVVDNRTLAVTEFPAIQQILQQNTKTAVIATQQMGIDYLIKKKKK